MRFFSAACPARSVDVKDAAGQLNRIKDSKLFSSIHLLKREQERERESESEDWKMGNADSKALRSRGSGVRPLHPWWGKPGSWKMAPKLLKLDNKECV